MKLNHSLLGELEIKLRGSQIYLKASDIYKMLGVNCPYIKDYYIDLVDYTNLINKTELLGVNENQVYLLDSWLKRTLPEISENCFTINESNKYNKITTILSSIEDDDWAIIPCHGFSNNRMYEYTNDGVKRTDKYNEWCDQIPEELFDKFSNVNFSNPTIVVLEYDYVPKYDIQNFNKSIIDFIASYYCADDNNIVSVVEVAGNKVKSVNDGRIKIYIENL